MELSNEERETHLSLVADNRSTWHVYSDDPVMLRRLESIGAKLVRVASNGIGKHYELPANQVTLRRPVAAMSDAKKVELGERLRALRQNTKIVGAETARRDAE